MKSLLFCLLATLCLSVSGCGSRPGQPVPGNSSVVTGETLAATRASNLYEALQQVRPQYLRSRTASGNSRLAPVVYVDQVQYGSTESLRTLLPTDVDMVEYLDAPTATTRYGSGHMGGAILVRTKT